MQRELASREVPNGRPWPSDPSPPKIAGAGTPTLLLSQGASFDTSLTQASFGPSGRRSVEQMAAAVSTGRQPSRGAMPQLIPDGLPPDVHLKVALSIRHPYCAAPSCTVAVQYSVKHATESAANMVESRGRVCSVIEHLASALDEENERIIDRCDTHVAKVLRAFSQPKHVALMRELQLVAQLRTRLSRSPSLRGTAASF